MTPTNIVDWFAEVWKYICSSWQSLFKVSRIRSCKSNDQEWQLSSSVLFVFGWGFCVRWLLWPSASFVWIGRRDWRSCSWRIISGMHCWLTKTCRPVGWISWRSCCMSLAGVTYYTHAIVWLRRCVVVMLWDLMNPNIWRPECEVHLIRPMSVNDTWFSSCYRICLTKITLAGFQEPNN
jgi:hypothetical protein